MYPVDSTENGSKGVVVPIPSASANDELAGINERSGKGAAFEGEVTAREVRNLGGGEVGVRDGDVGEVVDCARCGLRVGVVTVASDILGHGIRIGLCEKLLHRRAERGHCGIELVLRDEGARVERGRRVCRWCGEFCRVDKWRVCCLVRCCFRRRAAGLRRLRNDRSAGRAIRGRCSFRGAVWLRARRQRRAVAR
jgi:hypothetical protein